MKRCLIVTTDANFFTIAQVAINTFLVHNPGWDIIYVGVDLNDVFINELRQSNIRFINEGRGVVDTISLARVRQIYKILEEGCYELVAAIDADLLVFDSIEKEIEEFLKSEYLMTQANYASLGFIAVKNTKKTVEIFKRATDSIDHTQHYNFFLTDQIAVNVAFWYFNEPVKYLDDNFHFVISHHPLIRYAFSKSGATHLGKPLKIIHLHGACIGHFFQGSLDLRYKNIFEVWWQYSRFICSQSKFLCVEETRNFIKGNHHV